LGKKTLYNASVSGQALEDLGCDDAGQGEGLAFVDHPPQLPARAAGRGTKEVHPDGAVHQNQTRFLRDAARSPFQMPLP